MDSIEIFLLVAGFVLGWLLSWMVRDMIEAKRLIDFPPKKKR